MELTGSLARREPAYHYATGFFLLAAAAPIVEVQDSDDPRVMQIVVEQNQSALPLSSAGRSCNCGTPGDSSSDSRTPFMATRGRRIGPRSVWQRRRFFEILGVF
jgi:hypothetical protein